MFSFELLAGIGIGIAVDRLFVSLATGALSPTICDLCRMKQKKSRAKAAENMLDIDEVKAKILIGIAYDIWRSSPLKQTGTVFDKNGELILYSVDFRGLLAENSGSLTACIFCQRVTDADKPKVMLYAKHKAEQAVVLSEDEKQLIYENICRAGFIRQR